MASWGSPGPANQFIICRFNGPRTIGLDRGAWVHTKRGEEQVFSDPEEIQTKESLTEILSAFPHAFRDTISATHLSRMTVARLLSALFKEMLIRQRVLQTAGRGHLCTECSRAF